jgi:hypothetical protein
MRAALQRHRAVPAITAGNLDDCSTTEAKCGPESGRSRREPRARQFGENIQADMRRRLVAEHPVEREAVHHGEYRERCRIRSLRRPAFDVDRVTADYARRQNRSDRRALVRGAGDFTAGQTIVPGVLQKLRPAGQLADGDCIPRRRSPSIAELMDGHSLVQHDIPVALQSFRTRLIHRRRLRRQQRCNGCKSPGIVGHMRLPAEANADAIRPGAKSLRPFEHALRYRQIGRSAQFQQGRVGAAGRRDERGIVVHQPLRIVDLREIRQVEGATHGSRRPRPSCDDQGELEARVDVEQLPPVLERQAPLQACLSQVEPAHSGCAFVGVKCRWDQHADGALRPNQLQIALGEHPETVQLAAHRFVARAQLLMPIQPVNHAMLLLKAKPVLPECIRRARLGQHPVLYCLRLAPGRRIQDGRIEPCQELACVRLHDVPWRVAQHGIEPARPAADAVRHENLREGQIPWQGQAARLQHRRLTFRHAARPRGGIGHGAGKQQPLVVGLARRQLHGPRPGAGKLAQRRQRRIQPRLRSLLQHEIGRVPPERCFQRPNLAQCRVHSGAETGGNAVRQQGIQRPAIDRQRCELREKRPGKRIALHQPMIEECQRQAFAVRL